MQLLQPKRLSLPVSCDLSEISSSNTGIKDCIIFTGKDVSVTNFGGGTHNSVIIRVVKRQQKLKLISVTNPR